MAEGTVSPVKAQNATVSDVSGEVSPKEVLSEACVEHPDGAKAFFLAGEKAGEQALDDVCRGGKTGRADGSATPLSRFGYRLQGSERCARAIFAVKCSSGEKTTAADSRRIVAEVFQGMPVEPDVFIDENRYPVVREFDTGLNHGFVDAQLVPLKYFTKHVPNAAAENGEKRQLELVKAFFEGSGWTVADNASGVPCLEVVNGRDGIMTRPEAMEKRVQTYLGNGEKTPRPKFTAGKGE